MGYRVRILRSAENEYTQVVDYLAHTLASPSAAQSFMNEFRRQVKLVSVHPKMHPLSHIPELAVRGYRSALVGRYLFLYTFDGQTVTIVHLFHQSQDYASLV